MQAGVAGVNFLVAAGNIGFAIPLLLGKIKMNRWYGFRIRKAFESEDLWQRINRYGAKQFIGWSALNLVAGLLALVLPLGTTPDRSTLTLLLIAPVLVNPAIPAMVTLAWAKKL